MDVGLRTENPAVLTLLQWKRDIMKTIINAKVTTWFSGFIPYLAILGILATFKDGRHFKEGQHENGLTNNRLFTTSLDYTSVDSWGFIWGESIRTAPFMARLWLIERFRVSLLISNSLYLLYLQKQPIFGQNQGRYYEHFLIMDGGRYQE